MNFRKLGLSVIVGLYAISYAYCSKPLQEAPIYKAIENCNLFGGGDVYNIHSITELTDKKAGEPLVSIIDDKGAFNMYADLNASKGAIIPTEAMHAVLYNVLKKLEIYDKNVRIVTKEDRLGHISDKHIGTTEEALAAVKFLPDEDDKSVTVLEYNALFEQMRNFGKNVEGKDDFKTVNQKFLNHIIGDMSQKTSDSRIEELESSILDVLIAGVSDKIFYTKIGDSFIVDFRLNVGYTPERTLFLAVPFHINERANPTEITLHTCFPISISASKLRKEYNAVPILDNPLNSMNYINRYITSLPPETAGEYRNMIAQFVKTLTKKGNNYFEQGLDQAITEEDKANINLIQMSQFGLGGTKKINIRKLSQIFSDALKYIFGEEGFDIKNIFSPGEIDVIGHIALFVSDYSIFLRLASNLLNDGRPTFLEFSPIRSSIDKFSATLQPFADILFNRLFLNASLCSKDSAERKKSLENIKKLISIQFYSVFSQNWLPEMKEQISYTDYVNEFMSTLIFFYDLQDKQQSDTLKEIALQKSKQEFEEMEKLTAAHNDKCVKYLRNMTKNFGCFTWLSLGQNYLREKEKLDDIKKLFKAEFDKYPTWIGFIFEALIGRERDTDSLKDYFNCLLKTLKSSNGKFIISCKFINELLLTEDPQVLLQTLESRLSKSIAK